MKKFEFTGETLLFLGRTLHRIRALVDIKVDLSPSTNLQSIVVGGLLHAGKDIRRCRIEDAKAKARVKEC